MKSIVGLSIYGIGFLLAGILGMGNSWAEESQTEEISSDPIEMPFYNSPEFTPEWISEGDPGYKSIHRIAPFCFLNQDGKSITNSSFAGKVYVANFFFTTCPGICPKMQNQMGRIQDAFASNPQVGLISHSVTPWVDSVEVLQKYALGHGVISDKWHLVTGDKDEIYKLARQSYFAEEEAGFDRGADGFLHTEHLVLIDQVGRIRGIYNGTLELEADRLIEDIAGLLEWRKFYGFDHKLCAGRG